MKIVRDAFFDTLRHHEMTTIFANPGSTEIPLREDTSMTNPGHDE